MANIGPDTRYVRTREGAEFYGQAIGTPILSSVVRSKNRAAQAMGIQPPKGAIVDSSGKTKDAPGAPDVNPQPPTLKGPRKFTVGGQQYSAPAGSRIIRPKGQDGMAYVLTPDGKVYAYNAEGAVEMPDIQARALVKRFSGDMSKDSRYEEDAEGAIEPGSPEDVEEPDEPEASADDAPPAEDDDTETSAVQGASLTDAAEGTTLSDKDGAVQFTKNAEGTWDHVSGVIPPLDDATLQKSIDDGLLSVDETADPEGGDAPEAEKSFAEMTPEEFTAALDEMEAGTVLADTRGSGTFTKQDDGTWQSGGDMMAKAPVNPQVLVYLRPVLERKEPEPEAPTIEPGQPATGAWATSAPAGAAVEYLRDGKPPVTWTKQDDGTWQSSVTGMSLESSTFAREVDRNSNTRVIDDGQGNTAEPTPEPAPDPEPTPEPAPDPTPEPQPAAPAAPRGGAPEDWAQYGPYTGDGFPSVGDYQVGDSFTLMADGIATTFTLTSEMDGRTRVWRDDGGNGHLEDNLPEVWLAYREDASEFSVFEKRAPIADEGDEPTPPPAEDSRFAPGSEVTGADIREAPEGTRAFYQRKDGRQTFYTVRDGALVTDKGTRVEFDSVTRMRLTVVDASGNVPTPPPEPTPTPNPEPEAPRPPQDPIPTPAPDPTGTEVDDDASISIWEGGIALTGAELKRDLDSLTNAPGFQVIYGLPKESPLRDRENAKALIQASKKEFPDLSPKQAVLAYMRRLAGRDEPTAPDTNDPSAANIPIGADTPKSTGVQGMNGGTFTRDEIEGAIAILEAFQGKAFKSELNKKGNRLGTLDPSSIVGIEKDKTIAKQKFVDYLKERLAAAPAAPQNEWESKVGQKVASVQELDDAPVGAQFKINGIFTKQDDGRWTAEDSGMPRESSIFEATIGLGNISWTFIPADVPNVPTEPSPVPEDSTSQSPKANPPIIPTTSVPSIKVGDTFTGDVDSIPLWGTVKVGNAVYVRSDLDMWFDVFSGAAGAYYSEEDFKNQRGEVYSLPNANPQVGDEITSGSDMFVLPNGTVLSDPSGLMIVKAGTARFTTLDGRDYDMSGVKTPFQKVAKHNDQGLPFSITTLPTDQPKIAEPVSEAQLANAPIGSVVIDRRSESKTTYTKVSEFGWQTSATNLVNDVREPYGNFLRVAQAPVWYTIPGQSQGAESFSRGDALDWGTLSTLPDGTMVRVGRSWDLNSPGYLHVKQGDYLIEAMGSSRPAARTISKHMESGSSLKFEGVSGTASAPDFDTTVATGQEGIDQMLTHPLGTRYRVADPNSPVDSPRRVVAVRKVGFGQFETTDLSGRTSLLSYDNLASAISQSELELTVDGRADEGTSIGDRIYTQAQYDALPVGSALDFGAFSAIKTGSNDYIAAYKGHRNSSEALSGPKTAEYFQAVGVPPTRIADAPALNLTIGTKMSAWTDVNDLPPGSAIIDVRRPTEVFFATPNGFVGIDNQPTKFERTLAMKNAFESGDHDIRIVSSEERDAIALGTQNPIELMLVGKGARFGLKVVKPGNSRASTFTMGWDGNRKGWTSELVRGRKQMDNALVDANGLFILGAQGAVDLTYKPKSTVATPSEFKAELDAASTVEDVSNAFRNRFPHINVTTPTSVRATPEYVENYKHSTGVVVDLLEQFPFLKGLGSWGVDRGTGNTIAYVRSTAWARDKDVSDNDLRIMSNYLTGTAARQAASQGGYGGHFVAKFSGSPLRQFLTHEFGHIIDNYTGRSGRRIARTIFDRRKKEGLDLNTVGKYAKSSDAELFAELFMEYHGDRKPTALAVEVMEAFQDLLRDTLSDPNYVIPKLDPANYDASHNHHH